MKIRVGTVKKRRYIYKGERVIKTSRLYHQFRRAHLPHVQQFYAQDDRHPMLFFKTPIYLTARNYVLHGKKIFDDIDNEPFVLHQCAFYKKHKRKFKIKMLKRLVSVIESIKKHKYAKGMHRDHLIGVVRGVNPYFGPTKGFELISGKHRAAAALALGYKRIRVGIWRDSLKK